MAGISSKDFRRVQSDHWQYVLFENWRGHLLQIYLGAKKSLHQHAPTKKFSIIEKQVLMTGLRILRLIYKQIALIYFCFI